MLAIMIAPLDDWLHAEAFVPPGDIREHPLEDCPACTELGDRANCSDTIEWIALHRVLWEEAREAGGRA